MPKPFGAVRAVDDVSLDIAAGSLTCLIGPNGAGKSTLLGCISGFHSVDAGYVRMGGRDITRWPAHRRARHGLATVFQTTRPLAQLDVLDNAAVGAHVRSHAGFLDSMLRPPWQWREEDRVRRDAREALEIVGLDDRASAPAAVLPLGQLRLLSLARALAQRPDLLLLDEPAAGLRAGEKDRLIEALQTLSKRGLTMVLVEHDMQFVGAIAERVVVLDRGRVIADGTPADVRTDPRRDRGLPRLHHAVTALLERRDLVVRYGPAVAVDGVSLTSGGRAGRARRRERRGEELAAECRVRRRPACRRHRSRRRRRRDGQDAEPRRAARADAGAGRAPGVPEPAGRGEPAARRVRPLVQDRDRHVDASLPPPARRGARAPRADLLAAAEAVRAARPPGRANVRRRAADGRDRPRAHGRATRARDRRALARARAARRRAARRSSCAASTRRTASRSCSSSRTRSSRSTSASARTCSRQDVSCSRARVA